MKKILSAIIAASLILSLSACAFAATGLGSYTTGKVADGKVSVDTYMCAVTLDENGKITGVDFDVVQASAAADTDAAFEAQSKRELGDNYGMKAISPIGKEYFEQMDALEAWCIGKTVEEVIAGSADDADLKAGCTVGIANQLIVLQEAAANAR